MCSEMEVLTVFNLLEVFYFSSAPEIDSIFFLI